MLVDADGSGAVRGWSEVTMPVNERPLGVARPNDAGPAPRHIAGSIRFNAHSAAILTPALQIGPSQTLAVAFTDIAADAEPRQVLNMSGPPQAVIETLGQPRRVRVRLFQSDSTAEVVIDEPEQADERIEETS